MNPYGIYKMAGLNSAYYRPLAFRKRLCSFGGTFIELVSAVALKGKPVAEFDYGIYSEEKDTCDQILKDYGLEKLDDPAHSQVWFFRPENKADASRRISELSEISNAKERTSFAERRRIGELFGYPKADIESYLSWISFRIIMEYATIGKVEFRRPSERLALMDKCVL